LPLLDIDQMTEEDVKTHFITPAIQRRGWTDYMSMKTQITDEELIKQRDLGYIYDMSGLITTSTRNASAASRR